MKKRSAKTLQQMFQHRSDEDLKRDFDAIGTHPDHRVKTGRKRGCVKLKMVNYGTDILNEQKRRRAAQPCRKEANIADGNGICLRCGADHIIDCSNN